MIAFTLTQLPQLGGPSNFFRVVWTSRQSLSVENQIDVDGDWSARGRVVPTKWVVVERAV